MRLCYFPLLLPLASSAQSTPVQVSMARQKLVPISTVFHFDTLVDARLDRSTIGEVHRGMENVLVPAVFSSSFTAELAPLFRQAMPTTAATRPVIVRVHTMAVHESLGAFSETASAELEVDFLEPAGPDTYRLLASMAELAEGKGMDATNRHADNLRQTIEQALRRLPATTPAAAPTLTWAQVVAGEEGQSPRFPVQTQPLQRGVYRSFEEFRQNNPTLTEGPFEVKHKPRKGEQWGNADKAEAWYLELGPNQPRRLVRQGWGVSDGTNAYIFHRGQLSVLQPAGNRYTFVGIAPPDAGAIVAGGMMGGALGGAIAGAASANKPQLYELRMASGRIVASLQPSDANGFAATDTAAVYFYRRADAAAPFQVLADGKPVGTLGPDQYLALSWRDRRRDLKICVQDPKGAACHTFVPLFGTATYLLYTPGATPAIQPVAAREGAFRIKHIKQREKK